MNVKNILCPIDYSSSGDAALVYATSLAKEYVAELHLVHVFEQPSTLVDAGFGTGFGGLPPQTLTPAELKSEEDKLNAITPVRGVQFRRKLLIGTPAEELVNYAKENDIDLVIMGTHGRTGLGRLLMGSVAEAVVRRSPCPVLTIKQPAKELQESS